MRLALLVLASVAGGLVFLWIALIVSLFVVRPRTGLLGEVMRVLPDTVRLLKRLATDHSVPRAARVRLWLLLVYLASPLDIVPDVIPVIGYADDAIIVAWVLRSVVRRAGPDAVRRNWPGTPDGLASVWKLARLGGT